NNDHTTSFLRWRPLRGTCAPGRTSKAEAYRSRPLALRGASHDTGFAAAPLAANPRGSKLAILRVQALQKLSIRHALMVPCQGPAESPINDGIEARCFMKYFFTWFTCVLMFELR